MSNREGFIILCFTHKEATGPDDAMVEYKEYILFVDEEAFRKYLQENEHEISSNAIYGRIYRDENLDKIFKTSFKYWSPLSLWWQNIG